jgi:hypothetical protein
MTTHLRKQIKPSQTLQNILPPSCHAIIPFRTLIDDVPYVPRWGVYVTRYVDYCLWPERKELVEEWGVASFSGGLRSAQAYCDGRGVRQESGWMRFIQSHKKIRGCGKTFGSSLRSRLPSVLGWLANEDPGEAD